MSVAPSPISTSPSPTPAAKTSLADPSIPSACPVCYGAAPLKNSHTLSICSTNKASANPLPSFPLCKSASSSLSPPYIHPETAHKKGAALCLSCAFCRMKNGVYSSTLALLIRIGSTGKAFSGPIRCSVSTPLIASTTSSPLDTLPNTA